MNTAHRAPKVKEQQAALVERIKYFLDQHGITQESLAKKLNARPATVSAWMQGHSYPGGSALARLPAALGVSPTWLFSGTGQPFAGTAESELAYARGIEQGQRIMIDKMRRALAEMELDFYKQTTASQGDG